MLKAVNVLYDYVQTKEPIKVVHLQILANQ